MHADALGVQVTAPPHHGIVALARGSGANIASRRRVRAERGAKRRLGQPREVGDGGVRAERGAYLHRERAPQPGSLCAGVDASRSAMSSRETITRRPSGLAEAPASFARELVVRDAHGHDDAQTRLHDVPDHVSASRAVDAEVRAGG